MKLISLFVCVAILVACAPRKPPSQPLARWFVAIALFVVTAFGQTVRINAGGPALTDAFGHAWQADRYVQGGDVAAGLANSLEPLATKRYGDFVYSIPVADGAYTVGLWFAENLVAAGGRTFTVTINTAAVLTKYDIVADVGQNQPVRKQFIAMASGGTGIRIRFATVIRSAAVNAIEILPISTVSTDAVPLLPTVTVLSGPDGCVPVKRPQSAELHPGGQLCRAPAIADGGLALGASLTDFNFGGVSTALTAPDRTRVHGYSFPSPMSAGNRFVAIGDPDGRRYALDRVSGLEIRLPNNAGAPIWDADDDNSYYYVDGPRILRHHVQGFTDDVAVDLSDRLTQIQTGGSTHRSADNWLAVWSEKEHQVCAVHLTDAKRICADYLVPDVLGGGVPFSFIDYSIMTDVDKGSGKRYVILMAVPALAMWSVDEAANTLHFETRGPEKLAADGFNQPNGNGDGVCDHGEVCLDAPHGDATQFNGIQYLITMMDTGGSPCGRELAALPIAAGVNMVHQRVTIATIGYCSSGFEWPDFHAGCSPQTGACVISTMSKNVAPYGGQLLLLQDLAHLVKLGFHRSVAAGSDSYWYSPRAAISADGRYLIYDSNLGRADEANGFSHEQVFSMRLPAR